MKIQKQGSIVVRQKQRQIPVELKLIEIETESKNFTVKESYDYFSVDNLCPMITLCESEHTLRKHEFEAGETDILLNEYRGWFIIRVESAKNYIRVYLQKVDE